MAVENNDAKSHDRHPLWKKGVAAAVASLLGAASVESGGGAKAADVEFSQGHKPVVAIQMPDALVLAPSSEDSIDARSHYSHRSHRSHRSHYSSSR